MGDDDKAKQQKNREDERRRLEREQRAKQSGANRTGDLTERRPAGGHETR